MRNRQIVVDTNTDNQDTDINIKIYSSPNISTSTEITLSEAVNLKTQLEQIINSLNTDKAKQSIPDNSKGIFRLRGMEYDLHGELETSLGSLLDLEVIEGLEGADITIESLETYTELGDQDYEYYNVYFHKLYDLDGNTQLKLIGISGYHIELKDA